MTEHEAEAFLLWAGWRTPREIAADRFDRTRWGGCPQCFRGDHSDPPAMCGDCEDDAYEAEREAQERAFWDEHEYECDLAFEALCSPSPEGSEGSSRKGSGD